MTAQFTTFKRALIRRLPAKEVNPRDIVKEVGCLQPAIDVLLPGESQVEPDARTSRPGHLTACDGEEILLGLCRSEPMRTITCERLAR